MKLQVPFIRLPRSFDAARLATEVAVFTEREWRPHPLGYAGNSALPLIGVNGDPDNEGFMGPMRPTPHLERCPYLVQVLSELGAVWGRTRLMRLSGHAEVESHVDVDYYWRERVRVHIPIQTQPTVRFICGQSEVNMAAGECWIFDTWRLHRVINDATEQRIHLVADTIGSELFWQLVETGRVPAAAGPGTLRLESNNAATVMTPWEMRHHTGFLLNEADPQPGLDLARATAMRFLGRWHALWTQYAESGEGWPAYRTALDEFTAQWQRVAANIRLRNGTSLHGALYAMVLRMALVDPRSLDASRLESARAMTEQLFVRSGLGADPSFDRPVFIVSPPRSGSTLLFETLSRAADVYTAGDESQQLIESIRELHPVARGYASNCLEAEAATPVVMLALRERFGAALRNRGGERAPAERVRMLEKTPKNALRVPFLARVFPEAHFVYVYRDPREVLASMIEAWGCGRFRTYPSLPGWSGSPWSLLLTPGWRDLSDKPLHEIVASQWQATTDALLDALQTLPRERVHVIRYDTLVATPSAEIPRLCRELDFSWHQDLDGPLPPSRYTVSPPAPDKWRRHAGLIEAILPGLAPTLARAQAWIRGVSSPI